LIHKYTTDASSVRALTDAEVLPPKEFLTLMRLRLTVTGSWLLHVSTMMLILSEIKVPHRVQQMECWIHWQLSSTNWKGSAG